MDSWQRRTRNSERRRSRLAKYRKESNESRNSLNSVIMNSNFVQKCF